MDILGIREKKYAQRNPSIDMSKFFVSQEAYTLSSLYQIWTLVFSEYQTGRNSNIRFSLDINRVIEQISLL